MEQIGNMKFKKTMALREFGLLLTNYFTIKSYMIQWNNWYFNVQNLSSNVGQTSDTYDSPIYHIFFGCTFIYAKIPIEHSHFG